MGGCQGFMYLNSPPDFNETGVSTFPAAALRLCVGVDSKPAQLFDLLLITNQGAGLEPTIKHKAGKPASTNFVQVRRTLRSSGWIV
jgi:hypothetical protein